MTIYDKLQNVQILVSMWGSRVMIPMCCCIFLEIKNLISVFIFRKNRIFATELEAISDMTDHECDRELGRILDIIEQLPGEAINSFIRDIFFGASINNVTLRDVDSVVGKYFRCGFDKTKRILKMVHKYGYYLDTKKASSFHPSLDTPPDVFYRPSIFRIFRDFIYFTNSMVTCILGYNIEINDDDMAIWTKMTSDPLKPTLLILPSTYGFTMLYYCILKTCQNTHNIIYIDCPNIQLRSGKLISAETMIRNICAIIRKENLTNIHVVGHSFGCGLANCVIEKFPDIVTKVVLIEPPILLGLSSEMFYTGDIDSANLGVDDGKRNSLMWRFYIYAFRVDHKVMNIIKCFFHPYNIFPKQTLLRLMKENKVMIGLSKNDLLINYDINHKLFVHLGANVVTSDGHHGLSVANIETIDTMIDFLEN